MPYGTYTEQFIKPSLPSIFDLENFIYYLLNDVCSESTNSTLSTKSQVSWHRVANLNDFPNFGSEGVLITFNHIQNDARNVNIDQVSKQAFDSYKFVVATMITMQRSFTNNKTLGIITNIVEQGISRNYNNGSVYQANVAEGLTFSSDLSQNITDTYPEVLLTGENPQNITHLTSKITTVFNINRIYN